MELGGVLGDMRIPGEILKLLAVNGGAARLILRGTPLRTGLNPTANF
jgi:hypothetical protein